MQTRRWLLSGCILVLTGCSRSPNVQVVDRVASPDGYREAVVESVDNQSGFGQRAVWLEIHVLPRGTAPPDHGDTPTVAFASEKLGRADVTLRWMSPEVLQISHPSVPGIFRVRGVGNVRIVDVAQ